MFLKHEIEKAHRVPMLLPHSDQVRRYTSTSTIALRALLTLTNLHPLTTLLTQNSFLTLTSQFYVLVIPPIHPFYLDNYLWALNLFLLSLNSRPVYPILSDRGRSNLFLLKQSSAQRQNKNDVHFSASKQLLTHQIIVCLRSVHTSATKRSICGSSLYTLV